ncbi:MAG: SOS response transcriptional repressor [Rhizobiales bacterium]|nr:SOS response transcriptional repressor [Hyphomicrobiales bacterium]
MSQKSGTASGTGPHRFTVKQGRYLAFIYVYSRMFRQAPAEADMQRHFRVTPPSVHQMVLTLERTGLIRRQPGTPRSIEVLVPPQDLPILEWLNINPSKPL